MRLSKEEVTPLLTQWSYVFIALTHRYDAPSITTRKFNDTYTYNPTTWTTMNRLSYIVTNIAADVQDLTVQFASAGINLF